MKKALSFSTIAMKCLIVLLALIPIALYIIGFCDENDSTKKFLHNFYFYSIGWKEITILTCLLAIFVTIISLRQNNKYLPVKNEILYVVKNGKYPILIGFAISNILLVLYFWISPSNFQIDRSGTSIGIFLSVMTIILGVHFLYEKEAPIIGSLNLLERITLDLKYQYKGGPFYIVFPALNIGFYTERFLMQRSIINDRNDNFEENTIIGSMLNEIQKISHNQDGMTIAPKFRAIIYDDEFVEELYKTYHDMIYNKSKEQIKKSLEIDSDDASEIAEAAVKECLDSCKIINELFEVTSVHPSQLVQPIIIVGDIVYVIADYGMPFYNNEKKKFDQIHEQSKPVELICWRRKDISLANSIELHLDKFIETIKREREQGRFEEGMS